MGQRPACWRPASVLGLAGPELPAGDGAADCDAVVPPDDPQPAAVTAAAASHATARPRRALTESVIIPIPFVLAGPALRKPQAFLPGLAQVLRRRPRDSVAQCIAACPRYLLSVTTRPAVRRPRSSLSSDVRPRSGVGPIVFVVLAGSDDGERRARNGRGGCACREPASSPRGPSWPARSAWWPRPTGLPRRPGSPCWKRGATRSTRPSPPGWCCRSSSRTCPARVVRSPSSASTPGAAGRSWSTGRDRRRGAATPGAFAALDVDLIPGNGLLAACVPGAFGAWMLLLRDHGVARLRDVMSYAIDYAGGGYPVVPAVSGAIASVAEHVPRPLAQLRGAVPARRAGPAAGGPVQQPAAGRHLPAHPRRGRGRRPGP